MALQILDVVWETTATTGTGTFALGGAANGLSRTFSGAGFANGDTCYYKVQDPAGGSNWETGIGTYVSAGNGLARTTVTASSNAGSLVNFGAGTKDVFVAATAAHLAKFLSADLFSAAGDLPVASAAGAVTRLAAGSVGSLLTANGAGALPSYQAPTNPARRAVHTVSGTPGTSTITLAAATGRVSVTAILGSTGTRLVEYEVTDGDAMEGGVGLLNLATGVLTRSAIDWKWDGTTYTNAPGTGLSLTSAAMVRLVAGDMAPQSFGRANVPGNSFSATMLPWSNWVLASASGTVWPASGGLAASTVYFSPVEWRGRLAVSKLCTALNAVGPAGSKVRYALYDMHPTTYGPGKLIVEGTAEDDITVNGGTVLHTVPLPATIRLPPGWYWAAMMTNASVTSAATLRVPASHMLSNMAQFHGNAAAGVCPLTKTITYNTFATAVGDDPALSGFGLTNGPSAFVVPMLGV